MVIFNGPLWFVGDPLSTYISNSICSVQCNATDRPLTLTVNSFNAINLNNARSASGQSARNQLQSNCRAYTANKHTRLQSCSGLNYFERERETEGGRKKLIFLCGMSATRSCCCLSPLHFFFIRTSFSDRSCDYMEIYVVKFQRVTSSASSHHM